MLNPEDTVTLYMRPGCHVCARVKKFLTEHDVPFAVRDVDADPLTADELWALFTKKADRLRVPFTAINDGDDVVLGYDPLRLEGVLLRGDRGGWQASTRLTDPVTVPVDDWDPDRAQRFATPPGSVLTASIGMAVRSGSAGVQLHDVPGGIVLGFEVTPDSITAVHRRLAIPGVTLPSETFAHRVALPDLPTTPGESHRYGVTYRHDTGSIEWTVDDHRAYWAVAPNPVEGFSLGLSASPDAQVRRTPWTVSLGE